MIQLDEQAQAHLDGYLNQVKIHLQGCQSVDTDEVVRDVQEHIERELQEIAEPVSVNDLDAVLKKLGSPDQWVPAEEISWWRTMIARLRTGPEDWRLAYVSLAFFICAFVFPPLLIASVLTSRAVLAVSQDNKELGAQRWLIYPSLIFTYSLIVLFLIFWPMRIIGGMADELERRLTGGLSSDGAWFVMCTSIFAGTSLCLLICGIAFKLRPKVFHFVFHPFAEKIKPNLIIGITAIAFLAFSIFGVLIRILDS